MALARARRVPTDSQLQPLPRSAIRSPHHAVFDDSQSLNISLTCAMAIYAAIATGRFPEGSLSEAERVELLARWMMRDVRAAKPILRQKEGLVFTDA